MKRFAVPMICFWLSYAGASGAPVDPFDKTESKVCREALIASGREWRNAQAEPFRSMHPGFSKTAKEIYFLYDIPGLEIYLEQGPYGGSHIGANKIHTLYLDYKPDYFPPLSYFRIIFGNKPIRIHLRDLDFSAYYHESSFEGDEILQIRIPLEANVSPGDLQKSAHLIISRSTGQVFGYGVYSRNPVVAFIKDLWLEFRTMSRARKPESHGHWYNSNSGASKPWMYEWAVKKEDRDNQTRGSNPPPSPLLPKN